MGRLAAMLFALLVLCPAALPAQNARVGAISRVGITQVEFVDSRLPRRQVALRLFYPTVAREPSVRFTMPFYTNLHLYADAEPAFTNVKHPLIVFSHGRGSNALAYAWFAEALASRGYLVVALDHYRANTYDSSIEYLANKLWQRPVDVGLTITFLLNDPIWRRYIDSERIGVAGHSQGGFTALWVGGAKVNPEKYLAFQRGWRSNPMVPKYLREELPLDARPALNVRDDRVKAVFAMAPGVIQAFGMDAAGLRALSIPAALVVGALDTQTPPKPNAEFAAKYIPHAQLTVIPGRVDHEIFVNECDQEGKDEFPEACIDALGVDRAKIHKRVAAMALKFFDKNLNVAR
jgi:predicted dienelactone hydrolase